MKKSERIRTKINRNVQKIYELINLNNELHWSYMTSEGKRFEEQERNMGTKKNPKPATVTVMFWMEKFKDEDTGKYIRIERSRIVKINGQKSFDYDVLEPFTSKTHVVSIKKRKI